MLQNGNSKNQSQFATFKIYDQMTQVKAITKKQLYRTEITARNHLMIVDEPKDSGGGDEAMHPFELLAASLASCTSITLRMYINRKEWEVDEIHVTVDVEFQRKENRAIFKRKIQWVGSLEEKQQKRILSIADACPVHKALMASVDIETEIIAP